MSVVEHRPLLSLSGGGVGSPQVRSSTVAPSRNVAAELSSFPCLSASTTTRVWEAFSGAWTRAQQLSPRWLLPVFTACEEYELIGAVAVGAAVALFVLAGFGLVLPSLEGDWTRRVATAAFALQVVAGYACLWLFRNTDPGYIPANEGAIGPGTQNLLASPRPPVRCGHGLCCGQGGEEMCCSSGACKWPKKDAEQSRRLQPRLQRLDSDPNRVSFTQPLCHRSLHFLSRCAVVMHPFLSSRLPFPPVPPQTRRPPSCSPVQSTTAHF